MNYLNCQEAAWLLALDTTLKPIKQGKLKTIVSFFLPKQANESPRIANWFIIGGTAKVEKTIKASSFLKQNKVDVLSKTTLCCLHSHSASIN